MEDVNISLIDELFADSLLKKVSKAPQGARRVLIDLLASARQGHLYLEVADDSSVPKELTGQGGPLWLEERRLYLKKNWDAESRVLEQLVRWHQGATREEIESHDLPADLNAEQREGVDFGLRHSLSLLTGGPGTGKTFTASRLIVQFLLKKKGRVAVAAPTGKAASALERALSGVMPLPEGMFVGTVHSLLKGHLKGENSGFLPYDLLIIDECSMMDAPLFGALLAAVSLESHLVLMGDPDQLPPVEVGSLFADLLELNLFPTTRLVECVRTRGPILHLAQWVRLGEGEKALLQIESPDHSVDLGFKTGKPQVIYERLWKEVKGVLGRCYSEEPSQEVVLAELQRFRILSCLRKGALGVDALNQELVKRLYTSAHVGEFVSLPVLMPYNDRELGLINGQTGVCVVKKEGAVLDPSKGVLHFPGVTLKAAAVRGFDWAFCLSVHKSQGSEYDEVLLLVPSGSERFGREVLYTAMTRTKQKLRIDGNLEIIKEAIMTSSRKRSAIHLRMSTALQAQPV